ncbi:hypothetical protein D3C76_1641390 [compost metagenome]
MSIKATMVRNMKSASSMLGLLLWDKRVDSESDGHAVHRLVFLREPVGLAKAQGQFAVAAFTYFNLQALARFQRLGQGQ